MDIADIIILIFFVLGGAIVQWWNGRKKNEGSEPPPFMGEPFPKSQAPRRNHDLDDLMEALGQAPKNKASGENRLPPAPPPLPRPKPVVWIPEEVVVEKPTPYVPRAEPASVSYESITSHDSDLDKRFAQFSTFDVEDMAAAARTPVVAVAATRQSQQNRWRSDLRSGKTLRKAMVLTEILQPPLALR